MRSMLDKLEPVHPDVHLILFRNYTNIAGIKINFYHMVLFVIVTSGKQTLNYQVNNYENKFNKFKKQI